MKKILKFTIILLSILALSACQNISKPEIIKTEEEKQLDEITAYYKNRDLTDIFRETGYLWTEKNTINPRIEYSGNFDGIWYSAVEYAGFKYQKWITENYIYISYRAEKEDTIEVAYKFENTDSHGPYNDYRYRYRSSAYLESDENYDYVKIHTVETDFKGRFDINTKELIDLNYDHEYYYEIQKTECPDIDKIYSFQETNSEHGKALIEMYEGFSYENYVNWYNANKK